VSPQRPLKSKKNVMKKIKDTIRKKKKMMRKRKSKKKTDSSTLDSST
jgi:hypothetical protein